MSMSTKQQEYVRAIGAWLPALVKYVNRPMPVTSHECHNWIEAIKIECLNQYGQSQVGSMRAMLSDILVRHGLDIPNAYHEARSRLGQEIGYGRYQSKIEFSRNVDGRRIPKPRSEQESLLWALLQDLKADLKRREVPVPVPVVAEEKPEKFEAPDDTPEETPEIIEPEVKDDIHPFMRKLREIRQAEEIRSETEGKRTPILEAVSGNRPAINAAKMLKRGIPTEALLHALAMDWPQASRDRYGIKDYDVTSFGEKVSDRHSAYSYVSAAIESRVPVCLIGPAGTFKSTLCKQIAEDKGLQYGFVPMTAGATPSWIVGAYVLDNENPYRSRSAMDCYENGGVFVFEEMDAADPNMLLVANNLIENDVFDNPVTGRQIKRHPDFIPVACMNSMGLGATATNSGRRRLDDATRNRFAMGRVNIMLDEKLELEIFNSILNG